MLFDTCGIRFNRVGSQVPRPTFGHLAAAGVAGAEEKNGCLFGVIQSARCTHKNIFTPFSCSSRIQASTCPLI
jgi:hypothetical protein